MALTLGRLGPQTRARALFADWTDRIAARRAAVRQAANGRRASSATSSSACGTGPTPKPYLHDAISTDKRNPTRQRQRADLRLARGEHRPRAGARSGEQHGDTIKHPLRDPKTPSSTEPADAAVALLGRRADLGRPHQHPQPDDGREGPRLVHRAHPAAATTRPSARRDPTTRPPRWCRSSDRRGSSRCTTRRRRSGTLIDTCFSTHHLYFAKDADNTLWTARAARQAAWWAGSTRRSIVETGDAAKSQGWTPIVVDTNGNGKRDEYVEAERAARSRPRTSASWRPSTACSRARSTIRSGARRWSRASRAWISPATSIRLIPGANPAETALAEIYLPPDGGYGPRGIDIDHQRRGLDRARERPHGELRPAQVQGAAERARRR